MPNRAGYSAFEPAFPVEKCGLVEGQRSGTEPEPGLAAPGPAQEQDHGGRHIFLTFGQAVPIRYEAAILAHEPGLTDLYPAFKRTGGRGGALSFPGHYKFEMTRALLRTKSSHN